MELYSVNNLIGGGLNREVVIDEFISAIWTERFIEAGEVEIVLPAVHEHLKLLAPGKLLGCKGSRELMLLENRYIEEGLVRATGKTIETYFNERVVKALVMSSPADDIMKGLVNYMQDSDFSDFLGFHNRIEGLRVDETTETGPVVTEDIPNGPVYDTLLKLGQKYLIGMSVLWQKIAGGDHELVFTTRKGQDLSDTVRFSPELDNFANVKQLLSVAGSKNVFQIKPPKWVNPDNTEGASMWSIKEDDFTIFRDRYVLVDCSDITEDSLSAGTEVEKMAQVYRMMEDRQWAAHRQYKKTKVVDGEVTPEGQFEYKKDYNLGDTVSVQGEFGEPIYGVITEYIRSQDETGERGYPTVAAPPDPITGPGA